MKQIFRAMNSNCVFYDLPNQVSGDEIKNISPRENDRRKRSSSFDYAVMLEQNSGNNSTEKYSQNEFFDWQGICGPGA